MLKHNTQPTVRIAVSYTALIAASLTLGYWAGTRAIGRTETITSNPPAVSTPSKDSATGTEDGNESDDSDNSNSLGDGDISSLRVDDADACKMVRRCLSHERHVDMYSSRNLSCRRFSLFGQTWECPPERSQRSKFCSSPTSFELKKQISCRCS